LDAVRTNESLALEVLSGQTIPPHHMSFGERHPILFHERKLAVGIDQVGKANQCGTLEGNETILVSKLPGPSAQRRYSSARDAPCGFGHPDAVMIRETAIPGRASGLSCLSAHMEDL